MTTLWKSLKKGLKSEVHDGKQHKWKVGKWYHAEGKISCCDNGFHASERIIDAMGFVDCEELALVEVKGTCDKEKDKQAWSDMKIVKSWKWTKKDSVKLAIFSAEQVIDIYEKEYPNDKRPREAIEAAKNWLKNPTEKNRLAAACAAKAAACAAKAAACAAARAAAWAAARAAAWAAAWAAAREAAREADKALDKIEEYIKKEILKI